MFGSRSTRPVVLDTENELYPLSAQHDSCCMIKAFKGVNQVHVVYHSSRYKFLLRSHHSIRSSHACSVNFYTQCWFDSGGHLRENGSYRLSRASGSLSLRILYSKDSQMAVSRPPTGTQRDSSDFVLHSIPIEVENGLVGIVFDGSHSNVTKEQASSEYIKSWAGVTRGLDALEIDNRMNILTALKFEIVSARICISERNNRKYVAYTIMATLAGSEEDQYPAVVERRYSEFLHLYLSLRRDFPELIQNIQFPRKAIVGNFSPETISERRSGFEQFLERIGSTSQLRNSALVTNFLQRKEIIYAIKLIKEEQFAEASYLVENAFRLLNKLQTDRAIAVLQSLCLLVSILAAQDSPRAMEWASLAVRRFQGVSDSDLLRYYVPLLNLSVDVSRRHGKGTALLWLQEHLTDLRQRGVALHDSTPLLGLLLEDLLVLHSANL